jgi:hypothetical protein
VGSSRRRGRSAQPPCLSHVLGLWSRVRGVAAMALLVRCPLRRPAHRQGAVPTTHLRPKRGEPNETATSMIPRLLRRPNFEPLAVACAATLALVGLNVGIELTQSAMALAVVVMGLRRLRGGGCPWRRASPRSQP